MKKYLKADRKNPFCRADKKGSDPVSCKSDDSITVLGSLNSGIFTPSLCKQIHLVVCKIQLHTMAAK